VLFIPLDPVLSSALQQDPSLLDEAASLNVIFATPATLLAILRFVARGWRQETFARNAVVVREGAEELYSRLAVVQGHITALGRHLRQSVDGYNKVVASVDGRLLPSARKMHQHGIGSHELEPVAPVEVTLRELTSSWAGVPPGEQEQGQNDHDEIGIDWSKALADLEEQDP
jgi:DNA recombination protein RmuC